MKAQITLDLGFPTEKGYLAYALAFFFKLELPLGTPLISLEVTIPTEEVLTLQ